MNRRQFTLGLPTLALPALALPTLVAVSGSARAADADPLAAAVAGPLRTARNTGRDPFRHPLQSLRFWGLKPGMTVLEIDPGGGYWTEILAPYLLATDGRYIAAVGGQPDAFKARYADRTLWGDITVSVLDETASQPLAPAGAADLVLTSRNIHDWVETPGQLGVYLSAFNAALKPNGVLAVEDHRSDPRPQQPAARDGYVSTDFVVVAAGAAGFVLEAKSEINANPKDTKDHPFGVWTLPPTRRTHAKDQPTPPGFDPARYEAIGESDRMTLRFRKQRDLAA
jgi:predicted methyltransferase